MPTYEYECVDGHTTLKVCKISEHQPVIECEMCGKKSNQVIVGGFSHRDADIPWLPSAVKVLQPDGERPIETRSGLRQYMKDNHIISKA